MPPVPEMHEVKKNGYLRQAWLVLALALAFGAALAGVEAGLKGRIEQNKLNEILERIPELVEGADVTKRKEWLSPDGKIAYVVFDADENHIGWVIRGAGQGFADRIEVLIGLDAEAEVITGLFVLAQKETPALGNKIVEPWFGKQFAGKLAGEPVGVTRGRPEPGSSDIVSVSGATVSSEAVCTIVNGAVAEFRGVMPADVLADEE